MIRLRAFFARPSDACIPADDLVLLDGDSAEWAAHVDAALAVFR